MRKGKNQGERASDPPPLSQLRNSQCTLCRLSSRCLNVCLMGRGNIHASLVLLTEAPSEHEETNFMSMSGPPGKFLTRLLGKVGINENDVYITNAIKCRPYFVQKPLAQELIVCGKNYLAKELRLIKPKVVLMMGKVSKNSIFGSMILNRGAVKIAKYYGTTFTAIYTYHPTLCLRIGQEAEVQFQNHLTLAKELSQ